MLKEGEVKEFSSTFQSSFHRVVDYIMEMYKGEENFQSSFHRVHEVSLENVKRYINFQSSFHRGMRNKSKGHYGVIKYFQSSFHRESDKRRFLTLVESTYTFNPLFIEKEALGRVAVAIAT